MLPYKMVVQEKEGMTINTLNTYEILLYLSIYLKTTNISESFSIHILIDFEAIKIFINWSFVEKHHLNIYKLLKPISTYNIDACYSTELDVYWDFNNMCIKSNNEWKTAFYTNYRLFKLLIIFFGIINSLAIF